jgi:hypothetical protein
MGHFYVFRCGGQWRYFSPSFLRVDGQGDETEKRGSEAQRVAFSLIYGNMALSPKIVYAAEGIWTEYSNRFNEIKDAPSHMFIVAPSRMTATEKTEWLEKCITENRSTVPV